VGLVFQAALLFALGCGGWRDGYAVMYAPRVMERVAAHRHITPAPCMVAWTHAQDRDIGRTWLHVEGPAGEADCLVVDLPQDADRPGLVERDIEVELGWRNRGICGRDWSGRARDCPVRVWVIPE